jgi:hypothetical protein
MKETANLNSIKIELSKMEFDNNLHDYKSMIISKLRLQDFKVFYHQFFVVFDNQFILTQT